MLALIAGSGFYITNTSFIYCEIGHSGQVSKEDGRGSRTQPKVGYEEEWDLARQRAKTADVSVLEWLNGVATYAEKRQRDLADFRTSCRWSLERAKNGEGTPFNPDTFLEDAKRWAQERDEANIPISDDQKPADTHG